MVPDLHPSERHPHRHERGEKDAAGANVQAEHRSLLAATLHKIGSDA